MVKYRKPSWQISLNGIHYRLSKPVQKKDEPYNLWALSGHNFSNASIDYSVGFRNLHIFGETAIDKNFRLAALHGLLLSPAPTVSISFVHRAISPKYQALYANAFTENYTVNNERGLFSGVSLMPNAALSLQGYVDLFSFPWLKFRLDAPSKGADFMIQSVYNPSKKLNCYVRFKLSDKPINLAGLSVMQETGNILIKNWRLHASMVLSKEVTIRNRAEFLIYNARDRDPEQGFLYYADVLYNPAFQWWDFNLRLERFETGGYNSRLYAYENDVLYNISIPAAFNKGYRFYVNLHGDLSKALKKWLPGNVKTGFWVRFAQTFYTDKPTAGSGLNKVNDNTLSELKLQFITDW